jgi:hypothetical protein
VFLVKEIDMILNTTQQAENFVLHLLELEEDTPGVIPEYADTKSELAERVKLVFGSLTFSDAALRELVDGAYERFWSL